MVSASIVPEHELTCGKPAFPLDGITALFQPIVYVNEQRRMAAVEALARGPRQTAYESPLALFGVARRDGTVAKLDRLCITKALDAARLLPEHIGVFLNVHPSTLCADCSFPAFLAETATQFGIAPRRLTLELLEHARVGSCECLQLQATVRVLKGYGVRLAVDDVGSVPDDLRRALALDPDFIKVDGDLVRGAVNDLRQRAVLHAIAQQATRSGANIIAEGIEDPAALDVARSAGILLAQGYLLGRPATAEVAAARARAR